MSRRRSTSRVDPIGTVRPEVRRLWPNDIAPADWPTWEPSGPTDEFQWFSLDIDPVGDPGADNFQVAVATPRGLHHHRDCLRETLLVGRFEPAEVERVIREFVSWCAAGSWPEVVRLLRTRMGWEYDGRPS